MKRKYLAALSHCPTDTFNHPTILVSAKDENDARALIHHLRPHDRIAKIKEVSISEKSN